MNSTSTHAAPPQPAAVDVQKRYRPEIEGLRIVAAVLVAIYHIWFLRVSGGVDVFFVVSGFLVTTSLLTRYNRERTVKFRPFVLGLLKRLLPNALVVLLSVTVVGFFVLPEVRHGSTIRELLASLFYYENWELALSGTDYLDQANEKSPVQHFWAMSIQGQFYIVLFLVVAGAVLVARRPTRSLGPVLVACLSILLALSLVFSVHLTHVDQPWAYFDTRARVWEFATGGLLALGISRVKLPPRISAVLGWGGLLVLISTGMLLDVGGSFPGYVALAPVGAAVLILLAGQNPTPRGVENLLGSRAMVHLGGFSYGLYLWHWPLLSFHYVVFDTKEVGLLRGVLIILTALGLSVLSTIFIERRIGNHVARYGLTAKGFAPILALAMVVLLAIVSWLGLIRMQSHALQQQAVSQDYPGAVAMQPGYPDLPARTPLPALIDIKEDKAKPYSDGCHQQKGSAEVLVCEYGTLSGFTYTVALVGGSKSAHWLPSLESFARAEGIRILSITKSGCRLSLEKVSAKDCVEWNLAVGDKLSEYSPDLVVTLADTADPEVDRVPLGFLEQFSELRDRGFPILAIRDSPHFPWDVPECLSTAVAKGNGCDAERGDVLSPTSNWGKLDDPPTYVDYVDYSGFFCKEVNCPAVIGNIVVYIDQSHMSATFSESLGPIVREDVMRVLRRNG